MPFLFLIVHGEGKLMQQKRAVSHLSMTMSPHLYPQFCLLSLNDTSCSCSLKGWVLDLGFSSVANFPLHCYKHPVSLLHRFPLSATILSIRVWTCSKVSSLENLFIILSSFLFDQCLFLLLFLSVTYQEWSILLLYFIAFHSFFEIRILVLPFSWIYSYYACQWLSHYLPSSSSHSSQYSWSS